MLRLNRLLGCKSGLKDVRKFLAVNNWASRLLGGRVYNQAITYVYISYQSGHNIYFLSMETMWLAVETSNHYLSVGIL